MSVMTQPRPAPVMGRPSRRAAEAIRALAVVLALIAGLIAIAIWSLSAGAYALSFGEVVATLRNGITGQLPEGDTAELAATVVWDFRFARMGVAMLAGGALALSGAILQYITQNPLADPSLVGVSQGAALVVVAVTVLAPEAGPALAERLGPAFHQVWRPVLALAGALLVAVLVMAVGASRQGGAGLRFILTGVGVAALISAITQTILTYGDIDRSMTALSWLAGSVHTAGWDELYWLTGAVALALPLVVAGLRPLSALRFGDEIAIALGTRVALARWSLVALAVGLAASAVAAVGPLGFVGLVAPHLARQLIRSNLGGVGLHLGVSALVGASMVGLADLVGRVLFAPVQIPAGLLCALIGVPVFVLLILRRQAE